MESEQIEQDTAAPISPVSTASPKTEYYYMAIGIAMLVYLGAVIIYDWRFATYFSCFSFALMAMGLVLRLRNGWLNLFTICFLVTAVYLISYQMIWIGTYGIYADFTYLNPSEPGAPFWVHIIMHGLPIALCFLVIAKKGAVTPVNWKRFAGLVCILVAWSYTMDVARFVGMPMFWIAYPLGLPLTVIWLLVYEKVIRPRLPKKEA